jgi:hypothetical protein
MKTFKVMCVLSIVLSSVALAAKPKASTYYAHKVTDTSAMLRGAVVDDGGEGCVCQYRYWEEGTDVIVLTGWNDRTPDDPDKDSPLHTWDIAQVQISGLKPATTYLFVLELKNDSGSDENGTPRVFTTLAAGEVPPVPAPVPAPAAAPAAADGKPKGSTYYAWMLTDTSALLRGAVVTDGGEDCKSRFRYWEKGTDMVKFTDWTGELRAWDIAAARITGLKPETTYMFGLELENCNGCDECGSPAEFTTPAPLMLSSSAGGVTTPNAGKCLHPSGTLLEVQATPATNCAFIGWVGTAVDNGNVDSPDSPTANVLIVGTQTLKAVFRSNLDTIYVDDDTPNDPNEDGSAANPYDSIQEAIDVARNGATVIVRDGSYVEKLDFLGKKLTVIGESPDVYPVIDANFQGPVVSFVNGEQDDSVLQGFVLTHGLADLGGGILCVASTPTIANCSLVDNWTTDPAGTTLYCIDGSLNLVDCVLENNHVGETPQ